VAVIPVSTVGTPAPDRLGRYGDLAEFADERTLELLRRRRRTAIVRRRGWLVRRLLVVSDTAAITAAFVGAALLLGEGPGVGRRLLVLVPVLPAWIVAAKMYGLFDRDEQRTDHTTVDDLVSVFHLITVGTWVAYVLARLTDLARPDLGTAAVFWGLAILLVTLGRISARTLCRRRLTYLQNTIIVGAGEVGQLVARKFLQHPEYGINLLGFLDAAPTERGRGLEQVRLLGRSSDLPAIVQMLDVERVVFAFSSDPHEETLELIRALKDFDVQIDIVPRLFEIVGPSVGVHTVAGLAMVGLPALHLSRSSLFLKRTLDILVSTVGLVLLSPLLALIAVRIKLDSPGPVFYRHERIGPRGRTVHLFKFRTMHSKFCRGVQYGGAEAEAEFSRLLANPARATEFADSQKLQDDPRVTPFGARLRSLSLDELPQLINVVLGQISLVGPRPVTAEELARYGKGVDALLDIRPGITGYWQINGRSELGYDERIRLDLAYLGSWSLKLDLQILAKTFKAVLSGNGAY
jgi:exopolysaccharide biosynthesis polyprenyl glycosylphosphotransferase